MAFVELTEALKVIESSLSFSRWRLKEASKRRLQTDVLALCTGLRPVVMVDYGGKMPELRDHLCAFIKFSRKESSIFEHLRVMVIEDMIYLIHVGGLSELAGSTINKETEVLFVDLEQDPPKMIAHAEKSSVGTQFLAVQKLFLSAFPTYVVNAKSSASEGATPESSGLLDLSHSLQDTMVTVPTLNGWLLGYPVVYLFGKEHVANAIYSLSTKSLHLYKISVCRNGFFSKGSRQEELMSFSVPYDLSMEGREEPWALAFLDRLRAKWEGCRQVWGSLQMEVIYCYPQAIAF